MVLSASGEQHDVNIHMDLTAAFDDIFGQPCRLVFHNQNSHGPCGCGILKDRFPFQTSGFSGSMLVFSGVHNKILLTSLDIQWR